jgi:GT2 family glycosyltransferase
MHNPSADRIDLSIVIVSYNVRDLLQNCLLSIRESRKFAGDYLKSEVIIIDNASRDNSVAMVRDRFTEPDVRLIENKDNRGFAAANNRSLSDDA